MQQTKKLPALILESIVYSISGSLFVVAVFLIEEYFDKVNRFPGFPVQIEESVGLIWLLLGLSFSSIFCNLIYGKTKKFFLKKFFLLILSTVTSFLMQMIFLINNSTMIENLQVYWTEDIYGTIGIRLFTKLFIALTLFLFLFEGFKFLLESLKKRNTFS